MYKYHARKSTSLHVKEYKQKILQSWHSARDVLKARPQDEKILPPQKRIHPFVFTDTER